MTKHCEGRVGQPLVYVPATKTRGYTVEDISAHISKTELELGANKVNYSFIKIFWSSVYYISQTFSTLKPNSKSTELNVETEIYFARFLDQSPGSIYS